MLKKIFGYILLFLFLLLILIVTNHDFSELQKENRNNVKEVKEKIELFKEKIKEINHGS